MRVLTDEEFEDMMEQLRGKYGEAIQHIMRIEATHGPDSHSLISCPPHSRALCDYYELLKDYKL